MIVADTNLLAYLYLPGEHTEVAQQVLRTDADWAVPVLWRSEFRSVLARFLRRGLLPMEMALEVFGEVEALVKGREYAGDTALVLKLVRDSSCSAYDCEFVALAEDLGVQLVTSDSRVIQDFPGTAISPHAFVA